MTEIRYFASNCVSNNASVMRSTGTLDFGSAYVDWAGKLWDSAGTASSGASWVRTPAQPTCHAVTNTDPALRVKIIPRLTSSGAQAAYVPSVVFVAPFVIGYFGE